MAGLQERRRAENRQRISDRPTRLFEAHGFESLTLAQVSGAADVSVKTVMNYFGAKEDLFFDAEPAILDALLAVIPASAAGPATELLRPLILNGPILAGPCPWKAADEQMLDAMRTWAQCERNSPTLMARRATLMQSWIEPLASVSGSEPWPEMLVGVLVLRHHLVQDGLIAGNTPRQVQRRITGTIGKALDALERGIQTT